MNIRGVPYYRVVGRIHLLRRLVAATRGAADRVAGYRLTAPYGRVERWTRELRERGICSGPYLDWATVSAIQNFARRQPCRCPDSGTSFRIGDVHDGRAPDGTVVAVADVENPLACPEIARLSADPELVEVVTRVLGYRPRRTYTRLFWSPVSALPSEARRNAGQTLDFHYDIDGCNTLYAYYYLTGVGPESGAHVTVAGSHGPKPFRIMTSSCFQPESVVVARYGRDKITVVTGGPGFGFIEDPACFHRALVPTREARLCLQFRFT